MTGLLVSLDVGGTLCRIEGSSVAAILTAASPLDKANADQIIRQRLYTQALIDAAVVAEVCDALQLPVSAFPCRGQSSPPSLLPGVDAALRSMSRYATLVTLSNVTCLDADTDHIHALLHPWVVNHFPSYLIGHAKPDPAAFRWVATVCRTTLENMVHIGDDWGCDVLGARAAGVRAVWVSNGRPVPEPERLHDGGVLVADGLAIANQYVTDLAQRRQS